MRKLPIAVQLYTLRDDMEKDFDGIISKVAAIGYTGVEFAGFGGHTAAEIRTLLDNNGLAAAGSHTGLDQFESDIQQVIDFNLAIGNRVVSIPYLSEDLRNSADAYKRIGAKLAGYGQTLKEAGLVLAYHNHDFEFKKQDNGELGMDILLNSADPSVLQAEIDTYWILHAGIDPVAYLHGLRGRVPLVHIKDKNAEDGTFAEVGTGVLPLEGIIKEASEGNTEWLIVEQDVCKGAPLDSVTLSFANLKKLGYA